MTFKQRRTTNQKRYGILCKQEKDARKPNAPSINSEKRTKKIAHYFNLQSLELRLIT